MAVPARPVSGAPIESSWGSVVHDTAVAMDIQAGTAVVNFGVAGTQAEITVTFPRPFAAAPTVALGAVGGSTYHVNLTSVPLAASFVVRAFKRDFTSIPAGTNVTCQWIAYGPRA